MLNFVFVNIGHSQAAALGVSQSARKCGNFELDIISAYTGFDIGNGDTKQ